MKAKKYITAMLIPAFIGTLTINAQSAQSRSDNNRIRSSTNREVSRDLENRQTASFSSERSTQNVRQREETRPNQAVSSRNNQQIDPQKYQGNNSTSARVGEKNSTYRDPKQMSISNNNNPRSNYAKPVTTDLKTEKGNSKPAKHNNSNSLDNGKSTSTYYKSKDGHGSNKNDKNWNKNYYGGKHYHHAYPAKAVKLNYHYDTYHHNYRTLYYPAHMDIYWTRGMYREYSRLYPSYTYWHYGYGHRIQTISTFEAVYNMGEVARVYGRVYATWYNRETDDYLLFFGGKYPQQNFTVVIPGNVARRYSWRPDSYFLEKHITATGLITSFEGKPEMVVKQRTQISLY